MTVAEPKKTAGREGGRGRAAPRDGFEVFRLSSGQLSDRVGGRMDGKGAAPWRRRCPDRWNSLPE